LAIFGKRFAGKNYHSGKLFASLRCWFRSLDNRGFTIDPLWRGSSNSVARLCIFGLGESPAALSAATGTAVPPIIPEALSSACTLHGAYLFWRRGNCFFFRGRHLVFGRDWFGECGFGRCLWWGCRFYFLTLRITALRRLFSSPALCSASLAAIKPSIPAFSLRGLLIDRVDVLMFFEEV